MVERLAEVVDQVERDPEVRAVLLTGAGRGFCSGANLSEIATAEGDVLALLRAAHTTTNRFLARIAEMEKPWVTAVNRPAVGGGYALALVADLVLAAESAYFWLSFVNVGLVADMGSTYLLPRLVGLHRANEIALLGDRIPAAEAARMGLINRAVPDDELMDAARAWATCLARGPARAIGAIKSALRRGLDVSFRDSLHRELLLQQQLLQTEDALEGISAYLQKREPEFR